MKLSAVVKKVQLFSERNSGSNYLEQLIAANLPEVDFVYDLGFKHWVTDRLTGCRQIPQDLLCAVLIRSPFDWLRSMHRQPWHTAPHLKQLGFSEFIRSEWHCVWDDQAQVDPADRRWMQEMLHERHPRANGRRYYNIIEMRTVKHAVWDQHLRDAKHYERLRHEAVLADPGAAVERVADALGVACPESITLPVGYKGKMSWKRRLVFLFTRGRKGGYQRAPKEPLSLEDIAYIRDQLDIAAEAYWGYDVDTLAAAEQNYRRKCLGEMANSG